MTEHRDDVHVNTSDLKKGERIVVQRDEAGRISSVRKVDDPCWIVTAYYGDPMHADVVSIRLLRTRLTKVPVVGHLFITLNTLYLSMGRSKLGQWWSSQLATKKPNFARLITQPICTALASFAPHHERD